MTQIKIPWHFFGLEHFIFSGPNPELFYIHVWSLASMIFNIPHNFQTNNLK